ncbi:MAG: UDP-N-acetylmuramate dehydrogenase [Desulfovibrionales bacterium]|nr:UDP-N-acetylmuramate dehydrogenase [Desulfovibrionales bacterium]
MEPSMAERTTLGFGGRALAEAVIRDEAGLDALPAALSRLGGEPMALGRGSNLLARDGLLNLVLVRAAKAGEPEIVAESGESARVRASAALGLPRLLSWLAAQGLSGLEGLSGIPGGVGGAVAMNAGSYGREICDKLASVRIFSLDRGMVELEREKISAGYRRFDPGISGFWLVWEAVLLLDKDEPARIKARMREVHDKKKATQPVGSRSAGCVFKNPPGESAGRLLDQAGMRGARLGGVGFSDLHANFLVNHGGGTSAQALEIMERARLAVKEMFNIQLDREVVVI